MFLEGPTYLVTRRGLYALHHHRPAYSRLVTRPACEPPWLDTLTQGYQNRTVGELTSLFEKKGINASL